MKGHRLNLADIQMASEMFAASPDGQAEQRRVEALIAALPDGELKLSGYLVCATGRCGTCHDCVEASES